MMLLTTTTARRLLAAGTLAAALLAAGTATRAAEEAPHPPSLGWSFSGIFGTFDKAQLQRGYKIYKEVCASCHSMDLLAFRNLADEGGPGFTEAQVKALATEFQIQDGPNETGDMFERPGIPSDRFPAPFPNENAARAANGGALPPDLSVIAKARAGGADYLTALMSGYAEPPADMKMGEGMNYNTYFPGHQIAMPNPLSDGQVTYDDDAPQTVAQYSRDVAAFLTWAAEPKLEQRHRAGFQVLVFLIVLSGLLYFTKRKVWADVDH